MVINHDNAARQADGCCDADSWLAANAANAFGGEAEVRAAVGERCNIAGHEAKTMKTKSLRRFERTDGGTQRFADENIEAIG
jgi:hypothetical protein